MAEEKNDLRDLVASVAAAYFENSHVNSSEIATVISQIAISLSAVAETGDAGLEAKDQTLSAPVATRAQIRRSITAEGLISFEDGRSYKTLKRHLTGKGLTPAQYREKWGLPHDYPMVAPSYSEARSAMARELGLGQRGAEARAALRAKPRKRANKVTAPAGHQD